MCKGSPWFVLLALKVITWIRGEKKEGPKGGQGEQKKKGEEEKTRFNCELFTMLFCVFFVFFVVFVTFSVSSSLVSPCALRAHQLTTLAVPGTGTTNVVLLMLLKVLMSMTMPLSMLFSGH